MENGVGILHPKCGTRFPNSERTGHCAACCRTFFGLTAFDAHQSSKTGRLVCTDPAADEKRTWRLDDKDRWHFGEPITSERKNQIWKR